MYNSHSILWKIARQFCYYPYL